MGEWHRWFSLPVCVGTWAPVTFPRLGRLQQGGSWFDTGPTYTHLVHPLHLPLLYIYTLIPEGSPQTVTTIFAIGERCASVQLAVNCRPCEMIMKADGSAYIVPASVYDEQPISRTYQYRKVRALHNYAYVISLYNT